MTRGWRIALSVALTAGFVCLVMPRLMFWLTVQSGRVQIPNPDNDWFPLYRIAAYWFLPGIVIAAIFWIAFGIAWRLSRRP
jgi:hypothetical protein